MNIAVRLGEIDPAGAYFATPGSSTYFSPEDPCRRCYDIGAVNLLDWRNDPSLARLVLEKTLSLCEGENHSENALSLIRSHLDELENGESPCIDYFMADEAPMAQAAREMGYGGLYVMESDDWVDASSVFIWDVANVVELTPQQRFDYLIERGWKEDDLAEELVPARRSRPKP